MPCKLRIYSTRAEVMVENMSNTQQNDGNNSNEKTESCFKSSEKGEKVEEWKRKRESEEEDGRQAAYGNVDSR